MCNEASYAHRERAKKQQSNDKGGKPKRLRGGNGNENNNSNSGGNFSRKRSTYNGNGPDPNGKCPLYPNGNHAWL